MSLQTFYLGYLSLISRRIPFGKRGILGLLERALLNFRPTYISKFRNFFLANLIIFSCFTVRWHYFQSILFWILKTILRNFINTDRILMGGMLHRKASTPTPRIKWNGFFCPKSKDSAPPRQLLPPPPPCPGEVRYPPLHVFYIFFQGQQYLEWATDIPGFDNAYLGTRVWVNLRTILIHFTTWSFCWTTPVVLFSFLVIRTRQIRMIVVITKYTWHVSSPPVYSAPGQDLLHNDINMI